MRNDLVCQGACAHTGSIVHFRSPTRRPREFVLSCIHYSPAIHTTPTRSSTRFPALRNVAVYAIPFFFPVSSCISIIIGSGGKVWDVSLYAQIKITATRRTDAGREFVKNFPETRRVAPTTPNGITSKTSSSAEDRRIFPRTLPYPASGWLSRHICGCPPGVCVGGRVENEQREESQRRRWSVLCLNGGWVAVPLTAAPGGLAINTFHGEQLAHTHAHAGGHF